MNPEDAQEDALLGGLECAFLAVIRERRPPEMPAHVWSIYVERVLRGLHEDFKMLSKGATARLS